MKALSTAMVAIRRSPFQSLLTIFVLMITFFVAYCFSFLSIGSIQTLSYFEAQPQVIAFMKLDAPDAAAESLASKIQRESYVKDVKVVSKKDALAIYQQENQDDPALLELVTEEILPASVEVSTYNVTDLETVKSELAADSNVDEVTLQEDVVSNLIRWTNALRYIGGFILAVLLGTSFLMIMVTISMKISSKRAQIKIMKFVGANNGYISSPYIWEAVITSIFASTVAFLFYTALVLYITPWLKDFLQGIIGFPLPWQFFAYQFGAGVLGASLLGVLASTVAVKRMLRK